MTAAYLGAKTAPADMETPATWQDILNGAAQYIAVLGLDATQGLNKGSVTPAAQDRDKAWFKTTPAGAPIGLFSWNGSDWKQTPLAMLSGTTVQRPTTPATYTLYYDTDIGVPLVFAASAWRTLAGSPGDVKFVRAATLATALTLNPGWVECTDARGRVIGAAGSGPSLSARAYGDSVGEETHVITSDEMASHTHPISGLVNDRISRDDLEITAWAGPNAPAIGESNGNRTTDSTGSDKAHNNMQPTIFFWCLQKS